MRHHRNLYVIVLLVGLAFLVGCSANKNTARVNVIMDNGSKFATISNISGNMSLNDWTDFTVRQEKAKTEIVLWRQATSAAGQGNLNQAQQYTDLAQSLAGLGHATAKLVNCSSYIVRVVDGPFSGTTLEPGASSPEKRVPVGPLCFNVIAGSSNGHDMSITIVRQVSAGDKTIALVNKRY